MAGIEDKFFDDKLKVGLNGSVELKDLNSASSFSDIRKNSGNLWGTDITYYPVDNTEVSAGVIVIQGSEETFFGKLQDADQIYLYFVEA